MSLVKLVEGSAKGSQAQRSGCLRGHMGAGWPGREEGGGDPGTVLGSNLAVRRCEPGPGLEPRVTDGALGPSDELTGSDDSPD